MNLREFKESIKENSDLCDLGYTLRELDWGIYCKWVCDCAEHVLPLAKNLITSDEMKIIQNALNIASGYGDKEKTLDEYNNILEQVKNIHSRVYAEDKQKGADEIEAFEVACYAIKQVNPDSGIYHEDVIYGAARAAYNGDLHSNDTAEPISESDCYDATELIGSQESIKEEQWQLNAMIRILNNAVG